MANKEIKFIWDFYGEDAHQTAIHHAKHLRTFFKLNQIEYLRIDVDVNKKGDNSIAYVISSEANLNTIKISLRPHRATIYEN